MTDPWHLWVGAVFAVRLDGGLAMTAVDALWVEAGDREAARGWVLREAALKWPRAEGWTVDVRLHQVPDASVRRVATRLLFSAAEPGPER